jgi:hypothetical protein
MKRNQQISCAIVISFLLLCGCKKKHTSNNFATIATLNFTASVDNMSDFMNGMIMFQNSFGNHYGVSKLKYLISEITIHNTNGSSLIFDGYHFIDINDANTLTFNLPDTLADGKYDYIQFTFGLPASKNTSAAYSDLNTINWNWPDMMGGGYHFMQLEGNFKDSAGNSKPFMTHLGSSINPSDSVRSNNDISIQIPLDFTISSASTFAHITIQMNINQWYENPNSIDFNVYGDNIMGNFQAQELFHQNGANGVFSLSKVTTN